MSNDKKNWDELKQKFDEWWPTADEFQQWMWEYSQASPDPILAWNTGETYLRPTFLKSGCV
ncbi:MAG: hypothetical protein ACFFFG_00655 [Candidatus Thorarchaeota archaeon]